MQKITDEWGAVGTGEHIDVDNLLSLTEPCWDSFFCGADGKQVPMSKVDKIRLQGKLITRQVPCVAAWGLCSASTLP